MEIAETRETADRHLRRLTPLLLHGGLGSALALIALGMFRLSGAASALTAQWDAMLTSTRHAAPGVVPLLTSAARLDGAPLVFVGIGILTATPILRVVLCLIELARAGDRRLVALSATVLLLLFVAIALGRAG